MSSNKKDCYAFFSLVLLAFLAVGWYWIETGKRTADARAGRLTATDTLTMAWADADTVLTSQRISSGLQSVQDQPIAARAKGRRERQPKIALAQHDRKGDNCAVLTTTETPAALSAAAVKIVEKESAPPILAVKNAKVEETAEKKEKSESATIQEAALVEQKMAPLQTVAGDSIKNPSVAGKPAAPRQFTSEQQRIYTDVLSLVKEKIVAAPEHEKQKPDIGPVDLPPQEVLLAANGSSENSGIGVTPLKTMPMPVSSKHGFSLAGGLMQSLSRSGEFSSWQAELKYLRQVNPRVLFQIAVGLTPLHLVESGTLFTGDLQTRLMFGNSLHIIKPMVSFGVGLAYSTLQKDKSSPAGTCTFGGGASLRLSPQMSVDAELQFRQLLTNLTDVESMDRDGFVAVKVGINYFFKTNSTTDAKYDENLMAKSH